jgi:hypothetical protein
MLASSEARFIWGMASLLSAAPFYAPGGQQLLQQLGPVTEQVQVRAGGVAGRCEIWRGLGGLAVAFAVLLRTCFCCSD